MASGNAGKIRELGRLLGELDVEVVAQSEFGVQDVDETGATFAENSLLKAQHASAQTGLPAIADDSGLSVDALDGAPGVFSARYSGPDATDDKNMDKLLYELKGVEVAARGAAFHCVATFVSPGLAVPLVAAGEWRGAILFERQGVGGFGYDPIFFDPISGCSSAELSQAQKNARSHRGHALRILLEQIKQMYQ